MLADTRFNPLRTVDLLYTGTYEPSPLSLLLFQRTLVKLPPPRARKCGLRHISRARGPGSKFG